jgi:probable HAF family extracellular repeat protein
MGMISLRRFVSRLLPAKSVASLALAASLGAGSAAAQTYAIEDLGTLGGGTSLAYGINAAGQVVGLSALASGREQAFLWGPGGMEALSVPGSRFGVARCVNAGGQVAGFAETPGGRQHAFLCSGNSFLDLGTLGGSDSYAYGINAPGQVVGVATATNGQAHAFRWTSGTMQDLGTLGGAQSCAYGINVTGQVAGFSQTANQREHAFLWINGAMQDLGTIGKVDGHSYAYGINDAGQVVGASQAPSDSGAGGYQAFRWSSGVMQNLNPNGLYPSSCAYAINGAGQVVGTVGLGSNVFHAFLYSDVAQAILDLNERIDPELGWELRVAVGINDSGQIAGYGLHHGQMHAFRLTPILSSGFGRPRL